ncbi:hypothetical protein BKA70DRAFT_1558649 [Coprinopsis sp. MPI-PUGE-AT-0042]|nr:hypothetical protein BKA70DRAFT_1558649 [Coprinopsis sp. MPI-PUGE-AT-0042]
MLQLDCIIRRVSLDPPNYTKIIAVIQKQILKADLFDATGLPPQISSRETTICIAGPPVLVQIKALTDIGISAFKLEEVRKAREERPQSGLGTEEDGEDEGDIEVEGEGPMPKYPRGTLMFGLSDGTAILKAMEYKVLPQLSLLTTPPGYKMQLKDIRSVLEVANLHPRNLTLLGGNPADNELRDYHFKQGLRQRLGGEWRGMQRRIPITSAAPVPPSNVFPYFSNRQSPSGSTLMTLSPTIRQAAPTLPAPPSRSSPEFDDDFDMNNWAALDEIEKAATPQAPPPPPPPRAQPIASSSSRTAPKSPPGAEDADLDLADDEDEGGVSHITAQPKQSKFPHILGKAPALGRPLQLAKTSGGTSTADDWDECDLDDSLQLGSDDLRYLAKPNLPSNPKPRKPSNLTQRRSRPPPSSQITPREIITISDSEGDSSVHLVDHIDMTQHLDTEADEKQNYAARQRIRR